LEKLYLIKNITLNLHRRVNNRELNKREKEIVELLDLQNEHLNLDHVEKLDLHFKEYRITHTMYTMDNGFDILSPRTSDTKTHAASL
jgi:hypothetical protein